ncbi:VanZ family protein [Maricaulis sp. D1M11]|uniref:VanZ family protein n=1 Tax=Maricaulis sp. D1M11 TaxID=3076117 RepID=UPI0039B3AAB2
MVNSQKMSADPKKPNASRPDRALRWGGRILFVTAVVLITDLALQPGSATPPRIFGSDKVEHFLAFLVLTVLIRLGWPRRSLILLSIIVLSYGALIELVQGMDWVGRTSSVADFIADGAGVAAGLALIIALFPRRTR